jgi:DNA-binding MarR family transcriptional regulator
LPCRDFSKSPEISGEDFKRACEIEEELLLMAIPGHAHSEFGRGALENKSGLSMRRATIAFDRLNKYGLIERNKNYNNGYHWILTEKGEEKREKLRASGAQRKESAT